MVDQKMCGALQAGHQSAIVTRNARCTAVRWPQRRQWVYTTSSCRCLANIRRSWWLQNQKAASSVFAPQLWQETLTKGVTKHVQALMLTAMKVQIVSRQHPTPIWLLRKLVTVLRLPDQLVTMCRHRQSAPLAMQTLSSQSMFSAVERRRCCRWLASSVQSSGSSGTATALEATGDTSTPLGRWAHCQTLSGGSANGLRSLLRRAQRDVQRMLQGTVALGVVTGVLK